MTRLKTALLALMMLAFSLVGGSALAAEGGFWNFVREQSANALFEAGAAYYSGTLVERDLKEAEKWWLRAAERGHVGALHNLGVLYYQGEGVRQSFEKAADFHRRAADKGSLESQHNLGMLYHRGEGVGQDFHAAYVWFSVAAEGGYAKSLPFRKEAAAQLSAKNLSAAQAAAARLKKELRSKAGN